MKLLDKIIEKHPKMVTKINTLIATAMNDINNEEKMEKARKTATKLQYEIGAVMLGATSISTVYATNTSANDLVKSIIDAIMALFPAVGIVIALVGAFKLFMAFRNDQPDAYSGAVKDIVIGGLLLGFKTLIWSGGANLRTKF